MSILKTTINGLPLHLERKELAPGIPVLMVSIQGDLKQFPMIFKKEFGGWFFVDKMTVLDFVSIQKEISEAFEAHEPSV